MSVFLPTYYYEWLDQLKESECVVYEERFWFISTRNELDKEVKIASLVTPSWKQLASLAEMYQNLSRVNYTLDQDGNHIPLAQLAKSIVIGDDNGDLLFVDPSNGYSVWCYYLDGGDVQSISSTLTKFINEVQIITI